MFDLVTHIALTPNDFMVGVNEHDLLTKDGEVPTKVKKIIVHPKYANDKLIRGQRFMEYDFALVQLDAPQNQKYICLPKSDNMYTSTEAVTAGWGLDDNQKIPSTPIEVDLKTSKNPTCDVFPSVSNNMICAGKYGNPKEGSCYGDSGGPLMVGKTLIGVVSRGSIHGPRACGTEPSIFSRVTKQLAWIKKHVDGTCTG